MMDLFSAFDPSTSIKTSMNWISISVIFIIPTMLWMVPSRLTFMWNKIMFTIYKELSILMKTKMKKTTILFLSLFSLILVNNIISLFPYIFPTTSHLVLTLTMALPMWMSFMLYGWIKETKHMLAHLVPLGTPPILMPFMVCIETVSNLIRPGTLAIRLAANLIAGHLILTLLGNSSMSTSYIMLMLIITIQIMMMILEIAVSIIQAYVFSVLMTLYSSEIN